MTKTDYQNQWEALLPDLPPFDAFWDPIVSYFSGRPMIDILKLDEYIGKHYPSYTATEMSLSDYIGKRYGNAAVQLVKEVL